MNEGKRQAIVAHDGNQVYGCALLKVSSDENKICTFFVHPDVREQGLGDDIMCLSLKHFGNCPIISVSDNRTVELQPLLKKHGFKIYSSVKDMY